MRYLEYWDNILWVIIGDFNKVFFEYEKNCGNFCDYGVLRDFREVVDFLGLRDAGFEGLDYIWFNRRGDGAMVEKRFDRFLVTESWLDCFSDM